MAGIAEERRLRVATMLLMTGIGLILLGLVLTGLHCYEVQKAELQHRELIASRNVNVAQTIASILFWLLVLVTIFSIAMLAFLRWSRRFRRRLLREPALPTPSDDVWAMHRLPEDALEPDDDRAPEEPGR